MEVKRTEIDVTSADRHDHADETLTGLVAWDEQFMPEPPVLLRGDTLTRVVRDEDDVKLGIFTKPALLEETSRACWFYKVTDNGTVQVPAPPYITDALLNRTPQQLPGLPRINRVTDVPVFGKDESLMTSPGYHPDARVYYAPADGVTIDRVGGWSDTMGGVDPDEVRWALDDLNEVLADFPFADDASRAHAIAMIIEPFVREVIGNEPTPLYGVFAHTPGTGKSLLVNACLSIGCGPVPTMTYTPDEDELRKRLTSMLMLGRPALFFDNVNQKLDSGTLAAALTSARWTDRILGHSKMTDVPVRNVWVVSANNPSISRELTRRIIPIFLESGDVDPTQRTDFKHPNLLEWTQKNRGRLAHAALTLAAAYFYGHGDVASDDGDRLRRRAVTAGVLASYPNWSRTIGGILKNSGVPGFLDNLDTLQLDVAEDTNEAAAFLRDWFERELEPMRIDDLVAKLQEADTIEDGYPVVRDPVEFPVELRAHRDLRVALTSWLRKHKNEVLGGYRVRKLEARHSKWYVEKVG